MKPERDISCKNCKTRSCLVHFCSEKWKEKISESKKTNFYRKNEPVFHEGFPIFGNYFIYEGKVKVISTTNDGKENTVRLLTGGDLVGPILTDDADVFIFNAFTLDDSLICFLDNKSMHQVLMKNPHFMFKVLQYYIHAFRKISIRSRNLSRMNVKEKVVDVLIRLYDIYGGIKEGERTTLNINFPQREIASLAGTSVEQICRAISELKKEKAISIENKKITIANFARFKEITANFSIGYSGF